MKFSPPTLPVTLGSRRELFIDDALIEHLTGGARRQLHHPQPREVVLHFDAPEEGTGCGYCSLFQDGDRYRLYYKGFALKVVPGKIVNEDVAHRFTCYAESTDGVHWTKPELGLVDYLGSRANNIVLNTGRHGTLDVDAAHPAIFKDLNPACPADARYKGMFRSDGVHGLVMMQSPDGWQWTPLHDEPVITDGAFDSKNLAFWDTVRGEYRAYWRCFPGGTAAKGNWHPEGPRSIRTATSPDLLHWSPAHDLTYVGSPAPEELYVSQIKPYHRAPHLFIGFPARYVERPWGASMHALPDHAHREQRSAAQNRYGTAITESLLMCSRDGVEFTRWAEGFLRPGPERTGTWNYGHQYLAWHLVETPSSLAPDAPPELSLYAVENYWTGHAGGSSLRRYTLRLDGFVSLQAPMSGGECVTRPVTFDGGELRLNFATSAAGTVRVELQSDTGAPLPGFGLEACEPIFGDAIDRRVVWSGNPDLSRHAGQPLRLRLVLQDADIYSFRFAHPGSPPF